MIYKQTVRDKFLYYDVWMSLDKVTDVDSVSTTLSLDDAYLLHERILSVLHDDTRKHEHDVLGLLGGDAVLSQGVKHTSEVGDGTGEQAVGLGTQEDDLLLIESVLLELTVEESKFTEIDHQQEGEALEDIDYLPDCELVVELEDVVKVHDLLLDVE